MGEKGEIYKMINAYMINVNMWDDLQSQIAMFSLCRSGEAQIQKDDVRIKRIKIEYNTKLNTFLIKFSGHQD